MAHELYPDLDALLQPDVLATLDRRPVRAVAVTPFKTADSLSGSRFLRVELDGDPTRRYVVKRIAHDADWLMRACGDRHGRAALAWQMGLYDRVPPEIDPAIVACSLDDGGAGRAILLRDVGDALFPPGEEPITRAENALLLEAMAALHAAFWGTPDLAAPESGFIDAYHLYHAFSPQTGRREAAGDHEVPRAIAAGWALLPDLVAPDIRAIVAPLLDDPTPLVDTLRPYVTTVVHADWKLGNLGIAAGPARRRVILLDWDRVAGAQPGLDLGWYLAVNSARLPLPKEAVIDHYRRALEARLGRPLADTWWQAQLDLSLLGAFLQLGWPKLLGAASDDPARRDRERAELAWWSARVRAGARRLG